MGSTKYIPFVRPPSRFPLCSDCFNDVGLRLEAKRIGTQQASACPNCKSTDGYALDSDGLHELQVQFFSRATAPKQYRQDVAALGVVEDDLEEWDIGLVLRPETQADWTLIRKSIGGRLWYRSPKLFYFGITNHFGINQSLQKEVVRDQIVSRLRLAEIDSSTTVYRVRLNLNEQNKFDEGQYDAPPKPKRRGFGRFDNGRSPLFYGSPNLQVCIHECRVNLLDNIFIASTTPTRKLSLIDLTGNYDQPSDIDPFDDLEWFFRGLMNASQPHVYRYCRRIAQTIKDITSADGFVYNSFYTGIAGDSEGKAVNYAIFGRPLADGRLRVNSINTVRLERIRYDYHLGPLFT
ncbi:RES family NAD+ phosphorylase [Bradyrhizobium sp.]|uniref:RES family NAD+ phosphorylase n=1 Tax=Bradyrhizobium sp. TaxID=376 RepID=UPI00273511B3|nr:RES family NAD+ phosphorylase [Bradyrhizobium sp.]MDP3077101.1 RES family NAD+ phosphorylase [Bradyrhizobium sp.]